MNTTDDRFDNGRDAVRTIAPAAADALDVLEAAMWRDVPIAMADTVTTTCAAATRIAPLPRPIAAGADETADHAVPAAVVAFAEQFALDVSAMSDDQRAALFGAAGRDVLAVGQAVYVADVIGRVRAVLDRLFGPSAHGSPTIAEGGLASGMDDLIRVVPGLQTLDPVLTELVRLRGARQHNCRKCKSLRSHSAFLAGADDDTFAAVDDYDNSSLDGGQQVALRFTDAFIWSPGHLDDGLVTDLRASFSADQQVELVLDIARNAANKLAVALGADGTDVTDGYEVYDVAADGSITYGMSRPG